jgi:hypothetical protein
MQPGQWQAQPRNSRQGIDDAAPGQNVKQQNLLKEGVPRRQ